MGDVRSLACSDPGLACLALPQDKISTLAGDGLGIRPDGGIMGSFPDDGTSHQRFTELGWVIYGIDGSSDHRRLACRCHFSPPDLYRGLVDVGDHLKRQPNVVDVPQPRHYFQGGRGAALTPGPSPTRGEGSNPHPWRRSHRERGEPLTPNPSPTRREGRALTPSPFPTRRGGRAPHPQPLSHKGRGEYPHP